MEGNHAAAGFGMLAQETRLNLVRLLSSHGASGMAAGGIARALDIAPSTLSFHLTALENAGLVQSTRQGRQIVYAVRFAALRELICYLTETCCAGRPELCGDIARLLPNYIDEETTMVAAFNVLFICTRNSARSIMAEAILERVGRGKFKAYSAGSTPAAAPMPEVLDRLVMMGHDVSGLRPKSWHEFTGPNAPRMDFVLTLCDPGDEEVCPDLGDKPVTATWPFPDPAKFTGSTAERLVLLNELYGMIRRRLEAFTGLPFATLDRIAMKARLDEMGESSPVSR
ncbi:MULTISPECIES: metalloregulator ArsR/SmtB family transcription factor [Rhodomicrobium]|uniref:metalloregulator ArsR/SmtB family transcription factor n=1 Tax=Rhodomicrobium TaxID=1068 RepID=UPI000B4BE624|nr:MULTISPECIES: metalloregulator ArsR/SmtB family transcription factor [Rhodomicrobium]